MTINSQSKPEDEVESIHGCNLCILRHGLPLRRSAPVRPEDLLYQRCSLLAPTGLPTQSKGLITPRELGDLLDEVLALSGAIVTTETSETWASTTISMKRTMSAFDIG